jgi:catechol 2,3-dioxygenase-like lactoylglutathione lyase family enzyme
MFTYVCLGTNDLDRAAIFYDATLGALGLSRCDVSGEPEWDGWIGWGTYADQGRQEVALWLCPPFDGKAATVGNGTMVALQAKSWAAIDAFHAAAVALRDYAHNTTPTSTPPTSAIPMATN